METSLIRARRHESLSSAAREATAKWREDSFEALQGHIKAHGGRAARDELSRHTEVRQEKMRFTIK